MIIKIENLSYIYNPGTPFEIKALDNINLEIERRDFIGLIGHTGSGKSTLVQHLNGLIKPNEGKIIVGDTDITDEKADLKEIRQKVGLVFQYPEHQLFEETVYEDIAFGPKNLGLDKDEVHNRVKNAMEFTGLNFEKLKDRSPFELSGGQKRRVAISGVLAMKPEVLILDEPTAGLDPKGRDEILNEIEKIYEEEEEMTIILVSHSMEDIAKLVNRIVVMHNGRIKMDGQPESVFKHSEELGSIGLDIPQITQFMKAYKKIGNPIRDDIFTVEEAKKELLKYLRGNDNA